MAQNQFEDISYMGKVDCEGWIMKDSWMPELRRNDIIICVNKFFFFVNITMTRHIVNQSTVFAAIFFLEKGILLVTKYPVALVFYYLYISF